MTGDTLQGSLRCTAIENVTNFESIESADYCESGSKIEVVRLAAPQKTPVAEDKSTLQYCIWRPFVGKHRDWQHPRTAVLKHRRVTAVQRQRYNSAEKKTKSCTDKHIGVNQTHCDQSIEREHHQKRYILAHCCTGCSRQEKVWEGGLEGKDQMKLSEGLSSW